MSKFKISPLFRLLSVFAISSAFFSNILTTDGSAFVGWAGGSWVCSVGGGGGGRSATDSGTGGGGGEGSLGASLKPEISSYTFMI